MRTIVPAGTPARLAQLGYDGRTWDAPANLPRGQRTTAERMPSAVLEPGAAIPWPVGTALDLEAIEVVDPLTERACSLPALLSERLRMDGFLVAHDGLLIAERYGNGMTPDDLHVVHSCTKTLTTMAIGFALEEGLLDRSMPMAAAVAELAGVPAWQDVTLQHVLDMATGIATEEHYEDPASMYWRYADAVGYYEGVSPDRQVGALAFVTSELTDRAEEPGTRFNYASYLTNLLAIALGRAYGCHPAEVYEDRIYRRIGAEREALLNLDAAGDPVVEGQLNLTLRDFARWAHLYVDGGRNLAGEQVLPEAWVRQALAGDPGRAAAFSRSDYAGLFPGGEYHDQAWLIDPGEGILAMLGIHGQFAYVDPADRLLIAGMSSFPDQVSGLMAETLQRTWRAVRGAVRR